MKKSFASGLVLLALVLAGCGGSDDEQGPGAQGSGGSGPDTGGSSGGASSGAASNVGGSKVTGGSGGPGTGKSFGPTYFRFGVNGGYYGPGIDRRESAQMSLAAGAASLRTTLAGKVSLALTGMPLAIELP